MIDDLPSVLRERPLFDIAKVVYDTCPDPALGPGPEWRTWSTIGEAIVQLLPSEQERDDFRAACQHRALPTEEVRPASNGQTRHCNQA